MNDDSIASKLQELFDLYKSGALNKEEYERLKRQILLEGEVDKVECEKRQEPEIAEPIDKSNQVLSEDEIDNVKSEKKQEPEIAKPTDKSNQVLSENEIDNAKSENKQEPEIAEPTDKSIQRKKGSRIWVLTIIGLIIISVAFFVIKTNFLPSKSGSTGQETQTVKDIDGNVYKTITIGKQVWMAENLRTTRYSDGTAIALVTDNNVWEGLITPAFCWYDNNSSNKEVYGALYNWFTVNTNNLCPKGWHVPTDKEWTNLSPLPGGYRYADGTFNYIKDYSYWWTATESSITSAYYRQIFWDGSDVKRDQSVKKDGFSVRCIRD